MGVCIIYLPGDQNVIPYYLKRNISDNDFNMCINFSIADITDSLQM